MTIKKSLLAAATATTLAIAGTGIASAADGGDLPDAGAGSVEGSFDGEALSTEGSQIFGSVPEGGESATIEQALNALGAVAVTGAAVAGSIGAAPAIYSAVQDFQDMVEDISGNLPALPF
ncbi:hypothetical protein ACT3SZ_00505 [Corynebacterium sp. AOP40-9SA-29]|uniref:hypothetical protein n=1 Tax=Corynebacterium sp. AOP40-9SA-29 TaxID=3457677 RepID=UPI004033E9E5